ncbi:MAG: DMT family transporter [Pseudomonadota bacterium]
MSRPPPPAQAAGPPVRQGEVWRNPSGALWLLLDMSLNVWALTIVKAWGLDIPAAQIVFVRAAVGLVVILPWIVAGRAAFGAIDRWGWHAGRIVLSTGALLCSFHALPRVPFALYSALQFTRPIVLMALAALLLGERIGARRAGAAALALAGVALAVRPGGATWSADLATGLLAAAGAVLAGSGAVIATRRLRGTPMVVMMTAYTAGLALLTAPLAVTAWVPPGEAWPLLLGVGVLAQAAQLCFLRAHARAEAGFLAVMSYLSLPLTATVGWLVFDEIPDLLFAAGAGLIVVAALFVAADRRQTHPPSDRPGA